MCSARVHNIRAQAEEAGVEVVWRQWGVLGASALSRGAEQREARAIIDPEALLLLSLYLQPAERRLRDFVHWWATVGSDLLSVQRTKTLLRRFPSVTEARLQAFASQAVSAGDRRWRRYASDANEAGDVADPARSGPDRELKGAEQPRLHPPPALVLRLRAGFGVTAKADVLAYLLGAHEYAATTQETADATAYARVTVRGALIDMERAGFIQETGRGAAKFFAPGAPWTQVLQLGSKRASDHRASDHRNADHRNAYRPDPDRPDPGMPAWRYWSSLFPFLAQVHQWGDHETEDATPYLLSSRARDIFEAYEPVFEVNRIEVPRPREYAGAAFLEAFEETIARVADWATEHV